METNTNTLESTMSDIMLKMPKDETATIVVPLYGFYSDNSVPDLTVEVLEKSMERLRSFFHKVYFIFAAEKGRLDPAIGHYLIGKSLAFNAKGVEVDKFATYPMYLAEGISYALEVTQSNFIICANPWIYVATDAVDRLLEKINGSPGMIWSGYNVRRENIQPEAFDSFQANPVRQLHGLDINLFGFTKEFANSMVFDSNYKTKVYSERDIWQTLHSKGVDALSSQDIKIYPFDIDWTPIEGHKEYDDDNSRFISKWGFSPGITK